MMCRPASAPATPDGPTLPVKAADGDLALPQAWRAHLVAVGGVEISLGYRSQATGLLEAPSADQPASFGVRGDQASHDDATVAAWFADRLDVAQDTITVEPMGSGVTARFRRRVSWADAG